MQILLIQPMPLQQRLLQVAAILEILEALRVLVLVAVAAEVLC